MNVWSEIAAALAADGTVALVTLRAVAGSSPREAGTRMVVRRDGGFRGTIGGGTLEWEVLRQAGAMLARGTPAGQRLRLTLGPDLGQCCGGRVDVAIDLYVPSDRDWIAPLALRERDGPFRTVVTEDVHGRSVHRLIETEDSHVYEQFGITATPVVLFGAGHVGRALVLALAPLPFRVTWVDSREDAFPAAIPGNTVLRRAESPEIVLESAPDGAFVVIMTHSHAMDLAIAAAALGSQRFGYVGLIGSETKKARFLSKLQELWPDSAPERHLSCPIGPGLSDKSPAAIALAAAFELMRRREALQAPPR